jgi:hypothetical protein
MNKIPVKKNVNCAVILAEENLLANFFRKRISSHSVLRFETFSASLLYNQTNLFKINSNNFSGESNNVKTQIVERIFALRFSASDACLRADDTDLSGAESGNR